MDTAKGPLPGAFPEEVEQEAPAWRESVLAQWRAETTDEQLVGIFAAAQEEAREAQDLAGKLEQELMRRAAGSPLLAPPLDRKGGGETW